MPRLIPGALACAAVCFGACKKKSPDANSEVAAVELQGHRGARGLAPENTIAGVRTALEIGVDTVEVDVHLTADSVPVVYHDPALNPQLTRASAGDWVEPGAHPLGSLTVEQLQAFDVGAYKPGSKYAARFPRARPVDGERIPTLDALIETTERITGGAIRYNIETKLTPKQSPNEVNALTDAVIAVIKKRGIGERATIQSFDWRAIARVEARAPELTRACLTARGVRFDTIAKGREGPSPWTAGRDVDDHGGSVPRLVKAAGCAIWSPSAFSTSRGEVAKAHELGLRVVTWTVNKPADIERALDLGVDGVITDEPDRAREVMAARGMKLPKSYVGLR